MTCQSHSRRNSLPPSLIAFFASRRPLRRTARVAARGFTLIEMLVSLAITLIMMGAVVTLFGVISESVSKSRSLIETSDRLRAAREVIQQDLQGATASLTPPLSPENDQGYFEIIEGPAQDFTSSTASAPTDPLFGDTDDVLMFTVRGRSGPFLGKYTPPGGGAARVIESPVAEVVYFLVQNGPLTNTQLIDAGGNSVGKLCTLYRRVLLVSPSLGSTTTIPADFYDTSDLSVHYSEPSGTPTLTANTLGDLTKRENRFAHYGLATAGTFPFLVDNIIVPQYPFSQFSSPITPASFGSRPNRPSAFLRPFEDTRLGDDVLLTNVIAFDVRVYDPFAPVFESGNLALTPSDAGWRATADAWRMATYAYPSPSAPINFGAYVDLGFGVASAFAPPLSLKPFFHSSPNARSGWVAGQPFIYDTWSLHYENDGIDNDSDGRTDLGTNGLDDDTAGPGLGLVDDTTEWDTQPPYAIPLRGIEITLRVYEPSSQQVREVVIVQNFDTKK